MIERILPPGAVAAELFGDEPAELFPEEEAAIARASRKRRREFTSVRVCARRALAALGHPPVPLVPGVAGAPRWPDGITGSMTHCDGYRACVLARTADAAAIGLDAEPNLPLPPDVDRMIVRPVEREHIAALARAEPDVSWDRLLFCAKEAVYKAWYPLAGGWLGFEQASVEFRGDGTFAARILVPGPAARFAGGWLCSGGHVVTLIRAAP